MTPERPHPELWHSIARMLLTLRDMLRGLSPGGFPAMATHIATELRLCGALVRRYLFALAREIILPPLRLAAAHQPTQAAPSAQVHDRARRFDPGERRCPKAAFRPGTAPDPAPELQWALALHSAEVLLAALRDPLPLARRLAFRLARGKAPPLRELPVPSHVLRAVHPLFDALLMRLDALARPDAWAGMHPDTG